MAWYLRKTFGHETLAAGMVTASRSTRKMLYDWADMIILVVPRYRNRIPPEYLGKLKVIDAGGDPFTGFDPGLIARYQAQLKGIGIE